MQDPLYTSSLRISLGSPFLGQILSFSFFFFGTNTWRDFIYLISYKINMNTLISIPIDYKRSSSCILWSWGLTSFQRDSKHLSSAIIRKHNGNNHHSRVLSKNTRNGNDQTNLLLIYPMHKCYRENSYE